MRRLVLAGLLAALALAGCQNGQDVPDGVLQPDDLPKASAVYPQKQITINAVAVCSAVNQVQSSMSIGKRPPSIGVEYRLEGSGQSGDYVSSYSLGVKPRFGSVEKALAAVQDAIDECSSGDDRLETFTSLTGLEPGAIGYRGTSETSDGPRIGERVFAVQGDRIVTVGVQHDGPGEPTVDVRKLLPIALERAKDAPTG